MPTFLFDEIIFGPVKSRRLGTSLGINLLPTGGKFCNFNCAYCECGWTDYAKNDPLPTAEQVFEKLRVRLKEMKTTSALPDVITYAGNGEPTLHPQFLEIIEGTCSLRDDICPECKITVLTNATMLHNAKVVKALKMVDKAFMKLDSAIPQTFGLVNKPLAPLKIAELMEKMKSMGDNLIIQTMFLRGTISEVRIDNTTKEELDALLGFYKEAQPKEVHVYSIARDTPLDSLHTVTRNELERIAEYFTGFGIATNVY